MNCPEHIIKALVSLNHCRPVSDGYEVTTHCTFPSGTHIRLLIKGGKDSFLVTDNGASLEETELAGFPAAFFSFYRFAKQHGLKFSPPELYVEQVSYDLLPAAIITLANAAKEMTQHYIEQRKFLKKRDFKNELKYFLTDTFKKQVTHEFLITGHSTKKHRFDHAIKGDAGGVLLIDSVVKEPSAINACIVSNIDVKQLNDPAIKQRIIYDDKEKWGSENLSLLKVAAMTLPFSKAPAQIQQSATSL